MPIFQLTKALIFPHPKEAIKDGLLAIGGDLNIKRLLLAYSNGIFPWFSEGDPIMWWSPDPRQVLFPEKFRISKTFRKTIENKKFEIKIDTHFTDVIENCAQTPRKDQGGTWITKEIIKAYIDLHKAGYAHSFETYFKNELVGGLYGVSLGKAFFGESMFFHKTDASKLALFYLIEFCKKHKFHFIDAQVKTAHLKSFGAIEIRRKEFLILLEKALKSESIVGKWEIF
ncbi:leucyl/phenylalanyl-tRNA--protein transferase [candidate division KSB1 bacterium]